jgi:hypothetical protein
VLQGTVRRGPGIVSTFISNIHSPSLREINVGVWGHFAACVCAHFEQSTISVAITNMTVKRNDDLPAVQSHLRELWDIPETPASGCVSRLDSRVQTALASTAIKNKRHGRLTDSIMLCHSTGPIECMQPGLSFA